MPIDKYLCNVNLPEFQPGPFSVRLKYELKQNLFDKRRSLGFFHFAYSGAIFGLLLLCIMFVVNPQTANKLNTIVFGEQEDHTLDMLMLAERNMELSTISNYSHQIRTVSSNSCSPLPFIQENRMYVIYKFTNPDNQTLVYFNEIRPRDLFTRRDF